MQIVFSGPCVTTFEKLSVSVATSVHHAAEHAIVPGCDEQREVTSAAFPGMTRAAGRAQRQKKMRHQPPCRQKHGQGTPGHATFT